MAEGVFGFDRLREACLADQPQGWRRCIELYAPLGQRLLEQYFPAQDARALLREVFRQARTHPGALWRTFSGASEKEFLLHFRRFILQQGRAGRDAAPETPLTLEDFRALLREFPPLQREMLALSFRRYTPEELKTMTKFTAESVRQASEQAREKLRARLGPAVDVDFLRRDHDALFAALEAERGEQCVPDRIFPRILDGQITWREREEAERHLGECLPCLNRAADYREVSYYYRILPPADSATVDRLAAALGLPALKATERERKKRWWHRFAGG